MKNSLPMVSAGRIPRGAVKVNGQACAGWVSWEADQNEFFAPDTFKACFAMAGLPAERNTAWWASNGDIEIELFDGFPADPENFGPSDLTSRFLGVADEVAFNYDDMTLEVSGRDMTAPLVDHKSSEKYVNQTASEVATTLAGKYGLTPVVTATTTKVGKYYQIDHVDLKSDRTEWDLLTWLAREEQFVVFVTGRELHFQPRPQESQDPWVLRYTPASDSGPASWNAEGVKFSRTLTIARDVEVTVTSWNSKAKKAYTRKATRTKGGGSAATVQKYSYRIAGLTPEQAQQRANQIRDEISRHEVKLAFDGPADDLLTMEDVIKAEGTGTDLDQVFYPQSITRSMTFDGGFAWTVAAKNHGVESEPSP